MKTPSLPKKTKKKGDAAPPAATPNGDNAGADDRDAGALEEKKRARQRLLTTLVLPVALLACVALLAGATGYVLGHLGLLVWTVTLLLLPLVHMGTQMTRRSRARSSKKAERDKARAPLPPLFRSRGRGWVDAILYRDNLTWRRVQWGVTAVALAAAAVVPAGTDPAEWGGWVKPALSVAPVLVWWGVVGLRQRTLTVARNGAAEAIRSIAAVTLKYPRTKGAMMPLSTWLDMTTGYRAVQVSEWDESPDGMPVIPRSFTVMAPGDLSVTDNRAWSEFEVNLAAKFPRESGWHVHRNENGSGATVEPAHYPSSAIWDGEVDTEDVMGYLLGESLDDPGQPQRLSLTNPSNHMLVTGGTGGGKSTVVETIMAQTLSKPMPWDPTLHGSVHVVDPKGPLAGRWAGRPGVLCSRGDDEGVNEDGDTISGFEVMAMHCELIEEEHQRRAAILKAHPDCATWHDLPDEVKKAERLAPMIVVLDEFLDHTANEKASGKDAEQIERDNNARDRITYLTAWWERKTRNVGIHVILIAQEAKMTEIGSQRVRMAVIRLIAGQMDEFAYKGMFGTPEVPNLPTMKKVRRADGVVVDKPIPGRCFLMAATGQKIQRFQAYWFGGDQNIDTLDKWLPRDPTPGVGVFGGDAAAVAMAAMPDLDGNGVPDAWEQPHLDVTIPSAGSPASGGLFPAADGGVAPAAPQRAPQCAYEGCENPSAYQCPRDSKGYCEAHTGASPDPAERGRFGQGYLDSHPLNRAQAADVYRTLTGRAQAAGLAASWAPVADAATGALTDQVQIRVTTPGDSPKMVAQVLASPTGVQARTGIERGGVYGMVASMEAVDAAIAARGGSR